MSAGLGNYSQIPLLEQYEVFKTYAKMKIISTASILTYFINENGSIGVYNQNDTVNAEDFQYFIKNETELKALPCIFCDSTIGACNNFSYRIQNLLKNQESFIDDSIYRAKKYGWEGYSVDFEAGYSILYNELTDFVVKWAHALKKEKLILSLWIGDPSIYNYTTLFNEPLQMITMSTYNTDYNDFTYIAKNLLSATNVSDIGFGFLTKAASGREAINSTEFSRIIDWLINTSITTLKNTSNDISTNTISIWSSYIDDSWYKVMYEYLSL